MLHNENYSCVVKNHNGTHTFLGRGVSDLYDMVKNKPEFLKGASIADKIIGKAAAALMILGGVRSIYTDIISLPAHTLLQDSGIEAEFGKIVPIIQNRGQTDWCPLEKICYQEKSVENILSLIEGFIQKSKTNN